MKFKLSALSYISLKRKTTNITRTIIRFKRQQFKIASMTIKDNLEGRAFFKRLASEALTPLLNM